MKRDCELRSHDGSTVLGQIEIPENNIDSILILPDGRAFSVNPNTIHRGPLQYCLSAVYHVKARDILEDIKQE